MKFELPASYTEAQLSAMEKAEALMKCAPDSIQRVFGGYWQWKDEQGNWHECVGFYPQRDLNCIQQVEKPMTSLERFDYAQRLHAMIDDGKDGYATLATAEKRADAILATMGITP